MKAIAFLGVQHRNPGFLLSKGGKKETLELPTAVNNLLSLKKPDLGTSKMGNKVDKAHFQDR